MERRQIEDQEITDMIQLIQGSAVFSLNIMNSLEAMLRELLLLREKVRNDAN